MIKYLKIISVTPQKRDRDFFSLPFLSAYERDSVFVNNVFPSSYKRTNKFIRVKMRLEQQSQTLCQSFFDMRKFTHNVIKTLLSAYLLPCEWWIRFYRVINVIVALILFILIIRNILTQHNNLYWNALRFSVTLSIVARILTVSTEARLVYPYLKEAF